jgi:hypothetical protein
MTKKRKIKAKKVFALEKSEEFENKPQEIVLRENPICARCGAKGRGYPKEGFAVLFAMDSLEKLDADGVCKDCAKHEAEIKATDRKVGKEKIWWKK